jgi:adenylosuccinate synthase
MSSRSQVAAREITSIATTDRGLGRAKIRHMPRRTRTYTEDGDTQRLAEVVKRYDRVEKQLAEVGAELKQVVVLLGRRVLSKDTNLTMAEIAHRVGWTREYVSRVVSDANKADGWTPPPKKD